MKYCRISCAVEALHRDLPSSHISHHVSRGEMFEYIVLTHMIGDTAENHFPPITISVDIFRFHLWLLGMAMTFSIWNGELSRMLYLS